MTKLIVDLYRRNYLGALAIYALFGASLKQSTNMSVSPSAAIFFHPEAYTTSGPKLMGRNAAGESFLRGYLAYSRSTNFWAHVQHVEHAKVFAKAVESAGRTEPVKAIDRSSLSALSQAGVLYYPGPGIGVHAWQRAAFGHGAWSLCGITHTTASAGAMDSITEMLTAPVQPWDALICTSSAVKDNVTRLLQAQADYLAQRLGAERIVLPNLPVIPLGIHTSDFVYSEAQRTNARRNLGADEKTHVVLFMGRLSFHAKAHPLAMYRALENAAKRLPAGERILLVECGWHANDYIARAYSEAAKVACPNVRVVTLDGRAPESREKAWAGADIFCSLSDNIQETFGIAPIEAMAAGLPVIVSDWDGYKDTVRDGVDGFRIKTLMPPPGMGGDLALRHALEIDTYDMYCGHACALVAVDIETTVEAFVRLLTSRELRKQMGESGRVRAQTVFDWSVIIPQYEALWVKLGEMRSTQASRQQSLAYPWPARMDPFAAFAAYPTSMVTPSTRLSLGGRDADALLAECRQIAMVDFARYVFPTDDECKKLITALTSQAMAAGELMGAISNARRPYVFRALPLLIKLGVLKVVE